MFRRDGGDDVTDKLTARQAEVLDAIRDYLIEKGYPPSIRELGKIVGIASLRGVTIHLDALERKGWIRRERTSRSIRILGPSPAGAPPARQIPLLGAIAAGAPLLAAENVESYITAPPETASASEEAFALRVRGDSMIGDGILDGDVIVVRSQDSADHGDIVAALIGDEATVKRLDLNSRPPRLTPSNPDYEPIEIDREDVRILGKVTGLLRTYGPGQPALTAASASSRLS